jgi:hypothetical protein
MGAGLEVVPSFLEAMRLLVRFAACGAVRAAFISSSSKGESCFCINTTDDIWRSNTQNILIFTNVIALPRDVCSISALAFLWMGTLINTNNQCVSDENKHVASKGSLF